jgi:hypothetical protein
MSTQILITKIRTEKLAHYVWRGDISGRGRVKEGV